ncbi:2-amino-4-hydroxy-6-hydroxymethyldihydropteridinediphosphokinase [Prevotellaceae bacterium HUN156]|nr:2-amino-4-hydroxy-6-hydroxymethyldihydropteridinediphosphokinase [Prevotellaceae bacterium HUN156]
MHKVYLGLGSNLGDRHALMEKAITLIGERIGKVVRQSSFIETEPWGFESDNRFLNAVILVETEHTPREVLTLTQQIEREMGRTRKSGSAGYADRPMDIDILIYDDLEINEPDLKIPHPLMHEREFVMIPLREVRK